MNQRISKLLRACSQHSKLSRKSAKKAWNQTPRNRRHKMRLELEQRMREE